MKSKAAVLAYSIMVVRQILVLFVEVRILVGQLGNAANLRFAVFSLMRPWLKGFIERPVFSWFIFRFFSPYLVFSLLTSLPSIAIFVLKQIGSAGKAEGSKANLRMKVKFMCVAIFWDCKNAIGIVLNFHFKWWLEGGGGRVRRRRWIFCKGMTNASSAFFPEKSIIIAQATFIAR